MPGNLSIDRDRCMGSGHCMFHAPNTFDLDDISVAVVIDDDGDSDDKIQMAIDMCPTHSISRTLPSAAEGDSS